MDNTNIIKHEHQLSKENRAELKGQKPCVLWFTGLSASGKSTIANALEVRLFELKKHTYLLDGDNIRLGLNTGLGFSDEDRVENIRRIGEVSKLFVESGMIVLTAFISPFMEDRKLVRALLDKDEFIEIFVDTPLNVCEKRDPKGLYVKAREGIIENFTGISSPYEAPIYAEIHIETDKMTLEESVEKIINYLENRGYFNA
ncbi:MAG: Adenylylsulfate kinase (EC [uncultured Sulfurovum sp.]|uniref:Adenylyl-sulfate kinase n=1 Tax=uncultured Sulfurovum sp. TaxID=269237 RepID=A0A6S6U726_9BACT|nr:MAG: Adenylylsulfate kinase (EC [uncultured Sulfurovum sp.]